MKRTISAMVGKGSVIHNSRKFKATNVDSERTCQNIDYYNENIKDVYHELFDYALERYNAKQTRDDRKISDYYEKIRSGKQEKPFHELILQIGDKDNMGATTENGELAKVILDEYFHCFQERNPSLRVFSAHLHMDEATPHLHIDFVPFTTGSKRELDTRVSLKQALAALGFKGGTRGMTEWNQWVQAEKEALAEVMLNHGIEWEQRGTHEKHLSVLDFEKKQRAEDVEQLNLELVSDVFAYAVRMGVVRENPCSKVVLPKNEQTEKEIYTAEDIRRFLSLLNGEPLKYQAFFNLMVYSGFRRGEMLGLEWKDVDFESNIISVRRTSNYTAARGTYTDTTKTKKSQRTLKFPQAVMDILRRHRDEQRAHAERLGDKWVETDRLFTKWNGEPMYNGQPYSWLKKFCEENGLPFHGIHSFRHTFASLLVNQGVDIVTVSGALGHSTVSTTGNIYCHMIDQAQAKISGAVSEALNL